MVVEWLIIISVFMLCISLVIVCRLVILFSVLDVELMVISLVDLLIRFFYCYVGSLLVLMLILVYLILVL